MGIQDVDLAQLIAKEIQDIFQLCINEHEDILRSLPKWAMRLKEGKPGLYRLRQRIKNALTEKNWAKLESLVRDPRLEENINAYSYRDALTSISMLEKWYKILDNLNAALWTGKYPQLMLAIDAAKHEVHHRGRVMLRNVENDTGMGIDSLLRSIDSLQSREGGEVSTGFRLVEQFSTTV